MNTPMELGGDICVECDDAEVVEGEVLCADCLATLDRDLDCE